MKKYSIAEIMETEQSEPVKRQRTQLLRRFLCPLIVFALVMQAVNWYQGNYKTVTGTTILLIIMVGTVVATRFHADTAAAFFVADVLMQIVFAAYRLTGGDPGGDAMWLWFMTTPPFAIYIAGLLWGTLDILFGQALLVLLAWTPISSQVVTPTTIYIYRLPAIYAVVALCCIAIGYSMANYQTALLKENREIGARLTEVNERRRVDRMTGLLNREYAQEQITRLLARQKSGALFLMDIDNFKMINDLKGHVAGDKILAAFAKNAAEVFGASAVLSRLGGDEFIAFVPVYRSVGDLCRLAQQMVDSAAGLVNDSKLLDKIGVSIGIALVPQDGETFDTLYSSADKGQYFAKRNGKNRFSFFCQTGEQYYVAESGADLNTLKRMVQSLRESDGAFLVEYPAFSKVYQFLERNTLRTGLDTQLLLFSLTDRQGRAPGNQLPPGLLPRLCGAVRSSLRTGDLMMEFSSSQVAVLLIGCSAENGREVATRIRAFCGFLPSEYEVRFEMDSLKGLAV